MTPQEILNEICKLPLVEQQKISADLTYRLDEKNIFSEPKMSRAEFNKKLLAKGLITHIPNAQTDDSDDFEPALIGGEPLSETIIRERR